MGRYFLSSCGLRLDTELTPVIGRWDWLWKITNVNYVLVWNSLKLFTSWWLFLPELQESNYVFLNLLKYLFGSAETAIKAQYISRNWVKFRKLSEFILLNTFLGKQQVIYDSYSVKYLTEEVYVWRQAFYLGTRFSKMSRIGLSSRYFSCFWCEASCRKSPESILKQSSTWSLSYYFRHFENQFRKPELLFTCLSCKIWSWIFSWFSLRISYDWPIVKPSRPVSWWSDAWSAESTKNFIAFLFSLILKTEYNFYCIKTH